MTSALQCLPEGLSILSQRVGQCSFARQMDDGMLKATENWLAQVDYDLATAEHMLHAGRYIYVIFMSHMA